MDTCSCLGSLGRRSGTRPGRHPGSTRSVSPSDADRPHAVSTVVYDARVCGHVPRREIKRFSSHRGSPVAHASRSHSPDSSRSDTNKVEDCSILRSGTLRVHDRRIDSRSGPPPSVWVGVEVRSGRLHAEYAKVGRRHWRVRRRRKRYRDDGARLGRLDDSCESRVTVERPRLEGALRRV